MEESTTIFNEIHLLDVLQEEERVATMNQAHPAHPSSFQISEGVWPVLPTSFKDNGDLDLGHIPELVEFYLKAGCCGIFAVAGSGEMFNLNLEERLEVARTVVETVGGRVQVIASGNLTDDFESQADEIEQMKSTGVDAVILILSKVPLTKSPWDANELTEKVLALAERTTCPLGMYECPSPEHRTLRPKDIRQITATGRFHFLKETTEERDNVEAKVLAGAGTPFRLFPASMHVFLQQRIPGVGGFNGIIANVIPEVLVHIDRLGDDSLAFCDKVRDRMKLLDRGFLNELYPASAKVLLRMRGLTLGIRARAGKNPVLSPEQQARLEPLKEVMEDLLSECEVSLRA